MPGVEQRVRIEIQRRRAALRRSLSGAVAVETAAGWLARKFLVSASVVL